MTYLNTHTRTSSPTKNDVFQPAGRSTSLFGMFMGYIKDVKDVQKNGRLRVWIPEFMSAPDNQDGWIIVNYCSPFAGATNVDTASKTDYQSFEGTQTSYGMWMVPPDINNIVLVMFINGDPSRGIWLGSLYNQFMNDMVPGTSGSTNNFQYPGKYVPVAEYNKWDPKITDPDATTRPYSSTKFKGLGNQGLINDFHRGVSDSSARRESPSKVFGIVTPGPVINPNTEFSDPASIRRKGGSAFIMDDATGSEAVVLTTKSGAQIKIDETNGFVYLINRDGTGWVQMDQKGNIDIFGATDVSVRAQRDINFRADRNVNIEAGQNIYMKAAMDTTPNTTNFTYDVNNIPKPTTVPYFKYVGEGNGTGGNIVMQALNNWHSTTKNTAYLTVVQNNLNVDIGNAFALTTIAGGQDFNSKMGIKLTTGASLDIAATSNVRIGANDSISVSSQADVNICANGKLSLNGDGGVAVSSVSAIGLSGSMATFGEGVGVVGQLSVHGGSFLAGPVALGGSVPVSPPIDPNSPAAAQSAQQAQPAEVKPMLEKINVLATWSTPAKFKRDSESLQTTVTRLPTYEPCPEHENFTFKSISGYVPTQTQGDKTYEGSGGAGNDTSLSPATNTTPGANNTDVPAESPTDSSTAKDFNMQAYQCQLKIHEGIRNSSYLDSRGLPTAGIGHLLRANEISMFPVPSPVSDSQISNWFNQDAPTSIKGAQELLGIDVWGDLTDVRKRACADLCYNLGKTRLSKFVNFLAAMKSGDYNAAGVSLQNSKWYTQVGRRGPNIITMIVQNVDPNGCDKKFPPTI